MLSMFCTELIGGWDGKSGVAVGANFEVTTRGLLLNELGGVLGTTNWKLVCWERGGSDLFRRERGVVDLV